MTSGQETDRVHSYNPGTRTGRTTGVKHGNDDDDDCVTDCVVF